MSNEGLHPALVGLLRELPKPGTPMRKKWKTNFLNAFESALDFLYPSEKDKGKEKPNEQE